MAINVSEPIGISTLQSLQTAYECCTTTVTDSHGRLVNILAYVTLAYKAV